MVATSGSRLLEEDAVDTLKKELLLIATVITPNIPEAEILVEWYSHRRHGSIQKASMKILDAVLLKGGQY